MNIVTHTLEITFAGAFVLSLAMVGVYSHPPTDTSADPHLILSGHVQTAYEDSFRDANPLKEISVNIWGAAKYGLFRQASTGAYIGENGWIFTREELELNADYRPNLMASIGEIADVAQQLRLHGIQLVTVIVPDKARVYNDALPFQRPVELQNRYSDILGKLQNAGIASVDIQKPLAASKSLGDVFMHDDTHWSPMGAKLAADAVALQIDKTQITQAKVITVQVDTIDYDGDLLRYIPTGALRSYIGPAQNTLDQYQTTVQSDAGLFGDATLDVVLVGTSFSAKPEWHFEGFLKQALGADVLNLSQKGQGPFAPMRGFLASDTLADTPPKVVIWEIPERYTTQELPK